MLEVKKVCSACISFQTGLSGNLHTKYSRRKCMLKLLCGSTVLQLLASSLSYNSVSSSCNLHLSCTKCWFLNLRCNGGKVSFSIVIRLLSFSSAASASCMAKGYCLGITSATNSALFPILYYFNSCTKKYTFDFPFKQSKTRTKCYHSLHICKCCIS